MDAGMDWALQDSLAQLEADDADRAAMERAIHLSMHRPDQHHLLHGQQLVQPHHFSRLRSIRWTRRRRCAGSSTSRLRLRGLHLLRGPPYLRAPSGSSLTKRLRLRLAFALR